MRSTRQGYHQRVVTMLEAQFPETAATQPELLAQHCTEVGLSEQAVRYWQQAGQHAIQPAAHAEAIAHLTQGLAVLMTLPPMLERARLELALQTALGPALLTVRGYASEKDTGEHVYDAELHRLTGEFLLQLSSDNQRASETCFQHAMTIAQDQGAKAWELRTATSLARLWQHQGERQQAHDLLAPVYNWFTEGFDTPDLQGRPRHC